MTDAVFVVVMCADEGEAEGIATALVDERLAACANWGVGLTSLFRWEGRAERQGEAILLMKTRADLFERLSRRVKELHSYRVPEILALPVAAAEEGYLAWVRDSTLGA